MSNDKSSSTSLPIFYHSQHVNYISKLPAKLAHEDSYEGAMSSHLQMSGIYWAVAALSLLHSPSQVKARLKLNNNTCTETDHEHEITKFVMDCYDEKSGGFRGNINHDVHLLYTLSAIQILAIFDELHLLKEHKASIVKFISSLQQEDGSFVGDLYMYEVDTRFSYCAVSALSILNSLDDDDSDSDNQHYTINKLKAAEYILSCQNFDGGFGVIPGAESHAGQIFCCVGALSILKSLHLLNQSKYDLLSWFLCERQCDSGGLNGRPEKQADVCYSWWILSSLSILGRVSWIHSQKLMGFICNCQDSEEGGISDGPLNVADIFHTFFGISGLSLMGYLRQYHHPDQAESYRDIDPVYALPLDVVQRLGLKAQVVTPSAQNSQHNLNIAIHSYDVLTYKDFKDL